MHGIVGILDPVDWNLAVYTISSLVKVGGGTGRERDNARGQEETERNCGRESGSRETGREEGDMRKNRRQE